MNENHSAGTDQYIRFESTHLEQLYQSVRLEQTKIKNSYDTSHHNDHTTVSDNPIYVDIELIGGAESYYNGQAHEAGYDSYMTGVVFACFNSQYNILQTMNTHELVNKTLLYRSLLSLNFCGTDQLVDSGIIYYISGLPSQYGTDDLIKLFYFNSTTHCKIQWITQNDCFVIYQCDENDSEIKQSINKLIQQIRTDLSDSNMVITSFTDWIIQMDQQNTVSK